MNLRLLYFLSLIIIASYSCKRNNNNVLEEYNIPEENELDLFYISDDKNKCILDTAYYHAFINGDFNKIIEDWENQVSTQNNSFEVLDYKKGIYYLSRFEITGECDPLIILKHHSSELFVFSEVYYDRYVYTDSLFEKEDEMGVYEAHALYVYDFLSYHSFGLINSDAMHGFAFRMDLDLNECNDFKNFAYDASSRSDSIFNLKMEIMNAKYPHWSFIDSVEKYRDTAISVRHEW